MCLQFSRSLWLWNSLQTLKLKASLAKAAFRCRIALSVVVRVFAPLLVHLWTLPLRFSLWWAVRGVSWAHVPAQLQPARAGCQCRRRMQDEGVFADVVEMSSKFRFSRLFFKILSRFFLTAEILSTWTLRLRCWAHFYNSCA